MKRLTASSVEPLESRIAPAAVAAINLADLTGTNGFKLSGVADGDASGRFVSDAGDVNGDGFGDLIIGAPYANETGTDRGASYVVFGKAGGFGAGVALSALNGRNGFALSGVADNDRSGVSVSAAGDVNGDGFGDLIVGAVFADEGGTDRGASYVVFGKAGGFTPTLNLSALDGANGFALSGVADYDRSGISVSAAGDVNGDGFADLLIGAPFADEGGTDRGASYVVFGKASGFTASVALSALNGTNGFALSGVADGDRSGSSVSAAGDVNGDGFADLLIGANRADEGGTDRGASYVVFGKADFSGTAGSLNLSALDGTNGFKLSGVADGDKSGYSVSAAGDANGDGFADLIIGAYRAAEGGTKRGAAYVVFGKADFSATAGSLALSALDGTNGFKLSGVADDDYAGKSVSAAGDVNGDGFGDLIIGAYAAHEGGTDRGASYVVFGKAGGFGASVALSALDGTNGFALSGVADGDRSGYSVSAAGDVNGDGFGDLLIGAKYVDEGGNNRGASYVVFGSSPLALSKDHKSATFTDVDGDKVTVTTTRGKFTAGMFQLHAEGLGCQLDSLALTDPLMAKTNLTFKAKPVAGAGNKMVNVGAITTAFDLGKVKLPGDLGQIDCGDGDSAVAALKSLGVASVGTLGATTQDASATDPLHSFINGNAGKVVVKGDVKDALIDFGGTVAGVKIGGSLIGGSADGSGQLRTFGAAGPVKIGGDVQGGSGYISGLVNCSDKVASVTIGGSLIGGPNAYTGEIRALEIGLVKIGGDLTGGSINGAASLDNSGGIISATRIAGVTIGGSIIAGTDTSSGSLTSSATIRAGLDLRALNVTGDIVGNATSSVVISARGEPTPTATRDIAIGKITVAGGVAYASILAGYNVFDLAAGNGDAQIGKVTVGGDWSASSLVAGIADSAADGFGHGDTLIPGGSATIIATIASITIKGTATGSAASGDFFGITAEVIKKAKINGAKLALTSGKDDLDLDATNNDFRLVEI